MQSSASFKMLWSLSVAPSAIVSAWRILLDKLPTKLNLVRRRVQLVNPLCPLCLDGDESTDHLFNTCRVVQQVWDQCDRWIGKVGVRDQATLVNFQSFCLLGHKQSVNRALKGVWVVIVSKVWSHRNKVAFKGGVADADEIFSLALLKSWLWAKYKMKRTSFSYSNWILYPVLCLQSLA